MGKSNYILLGATSFLLFGLGLADAEINKEVPAKVRQAFLTSSEYTEADGYTRWVKSEEDLVKQFFSKTLERKYFPDGEIEAFNDNGDRVFEKTANGVEIFYDKDGDVRSVVTDKTLSQFNKGVLVSREYRTLSKQNEAMFHNGYASIKKGKKEIKIFTADYGEMITVETPILFGYIETKEYIGKQVKSLTIKDKEGIKVYIYSDGNVSKSSLKVSFIRFLSKVFSRKISQGELDALTDTDALKYAE